MDVSSSLAAAVRERQTNDGSANHILCANGQSTGINLAKREADGFRLTVQ